MEEACITRKKLVELRKVQERVGAKAVRGAFFSSSNTSLEQKGCRVSVLLEKGEKQLVHLLDLHHPKPLDSVAGFQQKQIQRLLGVRTNPHRSEIAFLYANDVVVREFDERTLESKLSGRVPEWKAGEPSWWNYLSERLIAFVYRTTVYLWDLENGNRPTEWFTLDPRFGELSVQEVEFRPETKRVVIAGVIGKNGVATGLIEIFHTESGKHEVRNGQAFCFVDLIHAVPTAIVLVTVNMSPVGSALVSERLSPVSQQQLELPFKQTAPDDCPLSLHGNIEAGLVLLVTRLGWALVFDVDPAGDPPGPIPLLPSRRISTSPVFTSAFAGPKMGSLLINNDGEVLSMKLDREGVLLKLEERVSERLRIRWGMTKPKREPMTLPPPPSCIVCLDHPRSVLLHSCRHLILCPNCASKLNRCPICRKAICQLEYVLL